MDKSNSFNTNENKNYICNQKEINLMISTSVKTNKKHEIISPFACIYTDNRKYTLISQKAIAKIYGEKANKTISFIEVS